MTEPGKIVIKDKVYFEPDGLEKPDAPDFPYDKNDSFVKLAYSLFDMALKAYEASKQLIEVSNVIYDDLIEHVWVLNMIDGLVLPKNNQKCKAKVNGKAEIIELT